MCWASTVLTQRRSTLGPNGLACTRQTLGLLQRRPVWTQAPLTTYIGKEADRLEDVQAAIVHDVGEVLAEYADPRRDPQHTFVIPILRQIPRSQLASAAGMSERAVAAIRNGHALPRPEHRAALSRVAVEFARAALRARGIQAPQDDIAACAMYLYETRNRHGAGASDGRAAVG